MRLHETREETDSCRMCRGGRDVIMMDWFLVEGIGKSIESNLENGLCAMSGVQGFDM